jgi:hypothetical protein
LGTAGESELRLGVVHDHDVAHAGGGGAAAGKLAFDQSHAKSGLRAGQRTGRTNNAASGDDNIV